MEMSRKAKIHFFIGFCITVLMPIVMFLKLPPMEALEGMTVGDDMGQTSRIK